MLSRRMTETYLKQTDFLAGNLKKCEEDAFDPLENPNGFVNLGTAVNALNEAEIESWLQSKFRHQRKWQHYHELSGHTNVRETIASFLSEKLSTPIPLKAENLTFQAGVTTLLESLAFALGDPGDVFVINFPVYPRFASDISERAQIRLMGPALRASDNFTLSVDVVDNYIKKLKENGLKVKAFIHCNPHNPLGDIYDEETTLNLMKVCKKHSIHFISDEIYALSIFDTNSKFRSVLSMERVPDPEKTHFLWGFSKDFGIASFRFGVLHTWNRDLMTILECMCLYTSVEGHIQQIGAKMLSDEKWLNQTYFPLNLKRLREAFENCSTFFAKFGCQVRESKAGIFAWVNFSPFFQSREITVESEKQLFLQLMEEHKLYIPNGTEFGSQDPGWFRVIFAIKRDHWAEFCLRFEKFAQSRRDS